MIHTLHPPESWSKAVGELKVDVGTKLFYPVCLKQLGFLERRVVQNEDLADISMMDVSVLVGLIASTDQKFHEDIQEFRVRSRLKIPAFPVNERSPILIEVKLS